MVLAAADSGLGYVVRKVSFGCLKFGKHFALVSVIFFHSRPLCLCSRNSNAEQDRYVVIFCLAYFFIYILTSNCLRVFLCPYLSLSSLYFSLLYIFLPFHISLFLSFSLSRSLLFSLCFSFSLFPLYISLFISLFLTTAHTQANKDIHIHLATLSA